MPKIFYILILGAILLASIFAFIVRQNFILVKEDKSKGYNSYNQKNSSPATIIQYWKENTERTIAVKRIVYLDYSLMLIYGSLIAYALYFFGEYQKRNWLRYFFRFGILLIITGVACDAIQDNAIFQHLTKDKFTDFRYLTSFKFICIILSVLLLVTGIIYYKKDHRDAVC